MHVWLCHMTHWDWFRHHLHNARQHSLQVICMQGRWKVMQATWTEANFTCEFMMQAKIYFQREGNKTLTINEVLLHQLSRCCVWKKYCNNTALDFKGEFKLKRDTQMKMMNTSVNKQKQLTPIFNAWQHMWLFFGNLSVKINWELINHLSWNWQKPNCLCCLHLLQWPQSFDAWWPFHATVISQSERATSVTPCQCICSNMCYV